MNNGLKFVLLMIFMFLISTLLYRCGPASNPYYKSCMKAMYEIGLNSEEAFQRCK